MGFLIFNFLFIIINCILVWEILYYIIYKIYEGWKYSVVEKNIDFFGLRFEKIFFEIFMKLCRVISIFNNIFVINISKDYGIILFFKWIF